MTVSELIEHLSTLPPQLTVFLGDWNEGYACPVELGKAAIYHVEPLPGRRPQFSSLPKEYVVLGEE